ncbi:substrate-binding periplasmic protein [Pseudobdellovibrio sp. HCB154]|uniref:substrate-binding periplasmic protein n=1 Tax=Pseudobdellovibrio sp. HCB154 TaxID=3386277 RepID=UPI0039171010
MKRFLIFCILIYVLIPHLTSPAHAANIKFGIDASNSPPLLYKFDDPNFTLATGGFIYEVTVAIAEDLNQDYSISPLPESRMIRDLRLANIDLVCHISPLWDLASQDEFLWSDPLYTYSNILVGKKEIQFKTLEQVSNVTIGTVEKYFYHDLEEKFKNKILQRDDSASVMGSLKKLLDNRLDYVVMTELEFNLYKTTYPQLQKSSFNLDKTEIHCSLSKKSALSLKKLNKTITHLKNKKEFQKINTRYSNSKTTPRPIAYGMNDSNSPPFLQIDNSTETPIIQGGLFFDLGLELGKKLKRPIHFMLSPRKRLDSGLADGEIELVCYNAEAWAGNYAKDYNWSIPIFKQSNLVVGLKNTMENVQIKSLKDLKGKTLGTALGFVYPALMPYFKDGSIKREDALSGLTNITKLHSDRVQYIILNNLEYNYYRKKYTNLKQAPFEIDPVNVKCASSKKSDLKISDINTAVVELKKNGRLQKVFLPH